jgi:hypothetical protein
MRHIQNTGKKAVVEIIKETRSSSRWELVVLRCDIYLFCVQNCVLFFSAKTVDFGVQVPFYNHQLSINENTRAFVHFSNLEKCTKATVKLNRVNVFGENGTPKSTSTHEPFMTEGPAVNFR